MGSPSPSLICTCGAAAPAGARFCPMCARPLVENAGRAEEPETAPSTEAAAIPEPQRGPIRLSSPEVIRSCFTGALLAALLGNLIYSLFFLWYPAAGFLSVYNYRRQSGAWARVSEGVRLGFATGVMIFLISLTLFTLAMLLAGESAGLAEVLRFQIEKFSAPQEARQQMIDILQSPAAMSMVVVLSLAMSFIVTVLCTALGGALGAKILGGEDPQRGTRRR